MVWCVKHRGMLYLAAGFLLSCSVPSYGQQTPPNLPPSISSDRLNFEQAITHKILADELYLVDDRKQAAEQYVFAEKRLAQINQNAKDIRPEERLLLASDITYRKTLIAANLGFWGSAYSRTPINPVTANLRFQETARDLNALVKLVNEIATSTQGGTALQREEIEQQKEADVAALDKERSIVRQRYSNRQVSMLNDRRVSIVARQQEIEESSKQLRSDLTKTTEKINGLMAKALTQSLGMPDLQQIRAAAAGKSVSDMILAASTTMIGDTNSTLSKSLASYSKTTAEMADMYRKAKTYVDGAQKLKNNAEQISSALRSRSINELIAAGTAVYEGLDPATKAKLDAAVPNVDLKIVANLSREGRQLRSQLSGYVQTVINVNEQLKPMLTRIAQRNVQDFTSIYRRALTDIQSQVLAVQQQEVLARLVLRNWSHVVADEIMNQSDIAALSEDLSFVCADEAACRARIAQYFDQNSSLVSLQIENGQLKLKSRLNTAKTLFQIQLKDFVSRTIKREMDRRQDVIQAEVEKLITELDTLQSAVGSRLLEWLPDASFDGEIKSLFDQVQTATGKNENEIAGLVRNFGGPANAKKVSAEITAFQVGSEAVARRNVAAAPASAGNATGTAASDRWNGSPEREAALQALTMSGPYGAAIAVAIQIVSAIGEMSDLGDQINRLYDEDRQLTTEMLHIGDMLLEARLSESLADLEEQIATRQRQAALQKRDLLTTDFLRANEVQQAKLREVKLLLPRLYLKAELARMYFDTLDRALAMWVGESSDERGFIRSAIRLDPNWTRYALDGDIGVYDWLDRSFEGERADLKRLAEHWNRLALLAKTTCEQYHCDVHERVIGEVNRTSEISVGTLLSARDRERLQAWQRGEGAANISFTFLLSPQTEGLPNSSEAVRVVDVAIAAAADAQRTGLNLANLEHFGIGYLKVANRYLRESLLPVKKETLQFMQDDGSAAAYTSRLRSRWGKDLTLMPMEGYALYGLYRLSLRRSVEDVSEGRLKEIKIRFFYTYRPAPAQDTIADSQKVANLNFRLSCEGRVGAEEIGVAEVGMILPASEIIAAGDAWSGVKLNMDKCKIVSPEQ